MSIRRVDSSDNSVLVENRNRSWAFPLSYLRKIASKTERHARNFCKLSCMDSSSDLGMVLVISGPSGVGKDTVWQLAQKCLPTFARAITCSTRARREHEVEGRRLLFRRGRRVRPPDSARRTHRVGQSPRQSLWRARKNRSSSASTTAKTWFA